MKDRLHMGRPDWVRVEAQVRPGKAAEKLVAAQVSPLDAWGWSAWSKRTAEAISQVEVPRFAPPATEQDFGKTTLYLARAYRRHLQEMLQDFGAWECVGREFQAVWDKDDLAQVPK